MQDPFRDEGTLTQPALHGSASCGGCPSSGTLPVWLGTPAALQDGEAEERSEVIHKQQNTGGREGLTLRKSAKCFSTPIRTSSRSLRKPLKTGTKSLPVMSSPTITASSWIEKARVRRTFH